jgi:arylsulfatase A-like enzyme
VERPNIVLLSIDTLRADSLRAYVASFRGRATMHRARAHETLDRLATRGRTFTRAYSTASWTLPAHASIFTGLYPDRHGIVDSGSALGDTSTFVERLHDHGYETVGFTGGGFVGPDYGFTRGFEIYDAWRDGQSTVPASALPRKGKRPWNTKAAVFDRAKAFLKVRADTRPLFLFAHTFAVHDYFRSWHAATKGQRPRLTHKSSMQLKCLVGRRTCTAAEWRHLETAYESGVDHVDSALASLLAVIDERLGAERTIIIVVSDHGEGFDHARNRIHHGGRLHRDQLHVPFLIAGPGVVRGRSDEPVSLVDVGPTILELVGSKPDTDLDGRSLVSAVFGGSMPGSRDAVWAAEEFFYWEDGVRRRTTNVTDRMMMTARIDEKYWSIETSAGNELYDTDDRQQNHTLEAEEHEPHEARRRLQTREEPAQVRETTEVVDQLRALGYIQ